MMTIGGGSSSLKARYEVSPLRGIQQYVGDRADVVYARGYASPTPSQPDPMGAIVDMNPDQTPEQMAAEAVLEAADADIVIFVGGLNKNAHQDSEGADRTTLSLPYGQDELIEALTAANPNTLVVLVSGNAVAMPWVEKVPGILQAWFAGSEAGNALAAIVFGEVCPSGKLPFTFPVKLEDNGAHAMEEFPGDGSVCRYNEDIFVGYRWHDTQKIAPLFPFGHGLSYTTFRYASAGADSKTLSPNGEISFSVDVTNTGSRAGSETVQLYVHSKKSAVPRPEKELKGFEKVHLQPGETRTVTITIGPDAVSYFDEQLHQWVAEPGKYEARIGSSSREIHSTVAFEFK